MRRFSVRILGFLLLIGVAGWLAAAAQAAETSILQEVLRRGTVRIAVNTGNEPRQFVDDHAHGSPATNNSRQGTVGTTKRSASAGGRLTRSRYVGGGID